MMDHLLTEIQRQQKYLSQLPKDYTFPLFSAKQALLSQRASGYRDTASAAREIIDNALEAGASRIHVVMDTERQGYSKGSTRAIAFIDNGSGMLPPMARYALSWGGGTHFDEPGFIGRFGFGLPNASISQSRTTELYTRTEGQEGFTKAVLDIDAYQDFENQTIPKPEENTRLPDFVESYLNRAKLPLTHGTVVVWTNPDRLSHRKVSNLKERLINDFGATYRYLLCPEPEKNQGVPPGTRRIELIVEGIKVGPVDPLFVLPEGRYFVSEKQGGAKLILEKSIPVRLVHDHESGEKHLRIVHLEDLFEQENDFSNSEDESIFEQFEILTYGAIHVRIVRFPYQFAAARIIPRDKDKEITDANRRFEIRKSRRGMSFVRAGREIETTDSFPRSSKEVSDGLGEWPGHATYAYHWGIEVRFQPEMDDAFGITHDKQSVRPMEDFWRVLSEAGIDDVARAQQAKLQQEEKERRNKKATPELGIKQKASLAEHASRLADIAEGRGGPAIPEYLRSDLSKRFDNFASLQAKGSQNGIEEVKKALYKTAKERPYVIDIVDEKHGPFYEPEWNDQAQITVRLNRRHPFFEELYARLADLSGGERVREVVDLLLITLARAELTCEDKDMHDWYVAQREMRWSSFLKTSIAALSSYNTNNTRNIFENDGDISE